jgi:hypothetical protein
MSHLAPLIADLALILICAGIMTLLFKKLKQPLVLGYVVAGFLASPHMAYTPSVMDTANIQTWADIGVIFLLFALGLEFSFKKIVKVGGVAIIAACTIIFCMILLGIGMGMLMTMSILQFGFHGGLIGIGLMFPQFIIYVPCFFAVSKNVYEYSMRIWKNHSSFSGQVSTYIVKMLICAVVLCAGILSEVYCNPVIMKILIQNLKIF